MQTQWIFSSTFLPYTGEPIDFMLEDRNQPIHGTFVDGSFHSRWADYDINRVKSWRGSEDNLSAMSMEKTKISTTNGFVTMLKRLTKVLVVHRPAASVASSRRNARSVVVRAITKPAIAAPRRRIDSNQISS